MFIVLVLTISVNIWHTKSYQEYLLKFTDKFDYLKASDLIVFYFFVYFLQLVV